MSEEKKNHKDGKKNGDCGCGCIGIIEKDAEEAKSEARNQES